MKHIISLLSIVLLSISASLFGQTGYEIKFYAKGLKEGGKVQFAYYQGEKKLLQDTVFVSKDRFVIKGNTPLPRGLYLVALPDLGYFDLIISDDQFFEVETDTSDFISKTKIKGCDENTIFYDYLKKVKPLQDIIVNKSKIYTSDSCGKAENKEKSKCKTLFTEITTAQTQLNNIKKEYIKSYPNYLSSKIFNATEDIDVPMFEEVVDDKKRQEKRFNHYKLHFFDNFDFNESGMARTPMFEEKLDKYFKDLVVPVCDSVKKDADKLIAKTKDPVIYKYLVTLITTKYEKSNIMCMDCMTLHMFDKYYLKDSAKTDWVTSETRQKLREEVWKLQHNQCNEKVYPMTKKDTNGVAYDIMKIDAEYTIVYFWSATCGHCKKTTPKLLEMYHRIKDEYNVEVYSVHIDKDRTEFDKYVKEHKFDWILTIDDGKDPNYRTAYNVFSTPTIYLLNNKKEIIAKKVDITVLEKIITGKEVAPSEEEVH